MAPPSNPQQRETDILIVGAGPTGLILAAALSRSGVRVVLIEKAPTRSPYSKALVIQAGTLEALEYEFGPALVGKILERSAILKEGFLHLGKRAPVRIDLSLIPSPFNQVTVLSQAETESLFEDQLGPLGVKVERGSELVSLVDEGKQTVSLIRKADGTHTTLRSSYVIGCDGAHSTVRHQLGFSFHGGAFLAEFALGDVAMDWQWPHGALRFFSSGEGTLVCFPMKGEKRYRIITLLPPSTGEKTDVSLDELQAIASKLCPIPIKLSDPVWLTRFKVNHRMTEHLRRGRVFLAGDAAHIHSPAGGQGMNTGIQDALNLADKLARVLKKGEPEKLLSDYEAERLPVARQVLRGTSLLSRVAILPDWLPIAFARQWIIPLFLGLVPVQRYLTRALSQVAIVHRERADRQVLPDTVTS